jgi:outer membrane protein TolC
MRAQVEVSNVQAEVIAQRNQLNRSRTALLRIMGVSQKSDVEHVSDLVYVPVEADFEKAVRAALLNRPELYRGELDVLIQQAALRIAMSGYLPSLEAWYLHEWARPHPHNSADSTWGRQWQAGLRMTWTLFDGLRREGTIIEQRAILRQSVLDLADTEQKVFEEVKNALFDLADADELVGSQKLNQDLAAAALKLVRIGAKEGVNTELEVLDARSALTTAQGNYYIAMHSHLKARLILQRVIGMLGPPPGAVDMPEEAPSTDVLNELVEVSEEQTPAEPTEDATAAPEAEDQPAGASEDESTPQAGEEETPVEPTEDATAASETEDQPAGASEDGPTPQASEEDAAVPAAAPEAAQGQ